MSSEQPPGAFAVSVPAAGELHLFEHEAMACTWGIQVLGEDADYAQQVANAAFEEVDRLELELSRYIERSDVARLNALPAGRPLRVGLDLFECLELAERVRAETGRAFDVTAGSVSEHARRLILDRATRTVTKRADAVTIDLGGIGKGYALDQAVVLLHDWSVEAALIHSGQSTLYAHGTPPGQAGWTVALRDPVNPAVTLRKALIRDRALAGSGMLLHGPHIIDPRTGQPARGAAGTWALAPSAALADALSTAFMVMGADEVEQYCRQHKDVASLLYQDVPAEPRLLHCGATVDLAEAGEDPAASSA
ncbi:MAG: FAD:protein FMN transferase [Planctomycetes bacterium]|nr:FAD:protein FMN transferase [Planctomycetota bacterium]